MILRIFLEEVECQMTELDTRVIFSLNIWLFCINLE